jgi:hypothetical protein
MLTADGLHHKVDHIALELGCATVDGFLVGRGRRALIHPAWTWSDFSFG